VVVHAYDLRYSGRGGKRIMNFRLAQAKVTSKTKVHQVLVTHAYNPNMGQVVVQGQPGRKVQETLSQPVVWHSGVTYHPKLHRELRLGGSQF
jgi:hypothetical protein